MDSNSQQLHRHKVLVVDDHPIIRQGLSEIIDREPDLELCGAAMDVTEALRQAAETQPDVVIVDLSLGGENGIELIDYLKSRWPSVAILVYSAHDEQTFAGRALRAGALGYIAKREPIPNVVDAIRQVLRGEVYLSSHLATAFLQRAAVGKSLDTNPTETLSNREFQVFEMIGRGLNTNEIAQQLQVSPKTIESHRKVIKMKLNIHTSAQLSRRAFQWAQENS